MLIADILHSCRDERIAAAAVASIGGAFADEMRAEAVRAEQSVGALASSIVRGFAREAGEADWRALTAAVARADQPVLSGFRSIAERSLARRARAATLAGPRPAGRPVAAAASRLA